MVARDLLQAPQASDLRPRETPRDEARPASKSNGLAPGLCRTHRPTFRSLPEARSSLPSARACRECHSPSPAGFPEATLPGRARPGLTWWEYGIREENLGRGLPPYYPLLPPFHLTFKPGKMARRRGWGLGACVNRAEAGGGAEGGAPPTQKSKDQSLICMPGLWVCADVTSDNALWFRRF